MLLSVSERLYDPKVVTVQLTNPPEPKATVVGPGKQFWRVCDHGLFHKADANHKFYRADLAIVFVHGILSGPEMWDAYLDFRKAPKSAATSSRLSRLPLAQLLLQVRRIEVDCLAFRYPSTPFRSGSNRYAAKRLRTALTELFGARYEAMGDDEDYGLDPVVSSVKSTRNIIFITHSNGGLVVKELLVREGEHFWSEATKQRVPLAEIETFAGRTRQILNVCVPHFGARWLFSTVAALLTIILLPITLPLEVVRWVMLNFSAEFPFGFNSIGLELNAWNPRLRLLDAKMIELENRFLADELPFPAAHDFAAIDDLTIKQRERRDSTRRNSVELTAAERRAYRPRERIPMLGRHPAISLGLPLLAAIRDCLTPFARPLAYLVAERTITLTHYMECRLSVDDLLGPSESQPTGSQKAVFEYLLNIFDQAAPDDRVFLLSGVAGVGKTRLMSRFARHLAIRHLRRDPTFDRRVYYIQMREFERPSLATQGEYTSFGCRMVDAWIAHARSVVPECDQQVNAAAFRQALKYESYTLVLDGVDDFLNNHPDVLWSELEEAFEELFAQALDDRHSNKKRLIILSSRRGEEGLAEFYDAKNIARCELEPLSDDVIAERFPHAWALIQALVDATGANTDLGKQREALELLRTPLALVPLDKPGADHAILLQHPSLARLLDAALRAIIKHTKFPEVFVHMLATSAGGEKHSRQFQRLALDILTIVARVNYGTPDVKFTLRDLRNAVLHIRTVWDRHAANHPRLAAFDVIQGRINAMSDLERAALTPQRISKIRNEDDRLLAAVLRTVFESLAGKMWNYVHRSWEDFLVARYYCLCAKYQLVEEFGAVGYLPHITEMAGDLLGSDPESPKEGDKYILPASLIEAARLKGRDEGNLFYVCNALALATWNRQRCTVNATGLEALLECLEIPALQLPEAAQGPDRLALVIPVQRCFIINGLAVRALEEFRNGGEAGAHLGRLGGVALSAIKLFKVDPIFAHLCWCYLQALASVGIDVPKAERPLLTSDEVHTKTLNAVVHESDARKRRSLQLAFVQLVKLAPRNHDRLIATVHYLYILVVIFRAKGAWISETEKLLRDVFAQGSVYRELYMPMSKPTSMGNIGAAADLARGLADLFMMCERLFYSVDGRRQKP